MKKKIFLVVMIIAALICAFAISAFAEGIVVSETTSEEYGKIVQLSADPGLDNASQYVSTLNKINDAGKDKDALCILTDGTYFYVFPSSYIVLERADGRFDVYAGENPVEGEETTPGINQAIAEFNQANGTNYFVNYTTSGSGGGKKFDQIVRFVFPTDVKSVNDGTCCLRSCAYLVEVRIKHALDFSSGGEPFKGSSKLKTVVGFENVPSDKIANQLFSNCTSLESVTLPTDIVRIPKKMFAGSGKVVITNLAECTKLTTIGESAFQDTGSLVFTLPDTVTTIEKSAFQSAFSKGGSLTINPTSKLETIGDNAFWDCKQLKSIYIPSSVTSIGSSAFRQAAIKTLVNFENCKITTIQSNTFYSATALTSIKIPETVTMICSGAFHNTEKLALVYLPKSIKIMEDAFTDNQPTNALYIYTGDDTSLISDARINAANTIEAKDYVETNTYTGVNLVVGYSHCVVYYNGVHKALVSDAIVTTYFDTINLVQKCSYCGSEDFEGTIPALFTCLGYSAFENGKGEFSLNFRVNNEAIKDYMDATGKTVSYGLFATTKNAIGDKDIVSSNGTLADGAVMAEIPFDSFVALTIKMGGFKDDNQKASEFAIGAYVAVDDGEGKKYSYLQNEKPQDGAKYSFTTYNQITKPQN